ncbi:MAG: UPF0182 family protein [Bryobacteraceae bacterium]
MPNTERLTGRRQRRGGLVFLVVLLFALLICSRYIASTLIDYEWWSELHQLDTWISLLLYGTVPIVLASILFFCAFWIAFKIGSRQEVERSRSSISTRAFISRIVLIVFILLAIGVANATVDSWAVVRYFGGLRLPFTHSEFIDPIFGRPLHFYFFGLPFYNMLLRVVLVGAVLALLIYWLAAHLESLSRRISTFNPGTTFEFEQLSIGAAFNSTFVRLAVAILLLGLAIKFFFSRYTFLLQDHGAYLVGVDWVADHVVLPLQWLMIAGALAGAVLVLAKRGRWALLLLLILPVRYILPPLVSGLYVRPNELALERPYIQHHIEATRSAYALNQRVKETGLEAQPEIPIDYGKHKPLLDNVRLWDWRAFHDTVSQIQPLRPYVYIDSDVDRYTIDGQIRQVLIAPRELDIRQLGDARNRWINPHFIYTHGYGIVMAESNRITADGLPVLFIKDAPPVVTTRSLKFTKPEIYYGEVAHEPVFVDTAQPEFNYPSRTESVYTRYSGTGGFPISSPLLRMAAAIEYGDLNVILPSPLTASTRMMIHRPILQRLRTLAGFLTWDNDPYLVITNAGRLVWIVDGYMMSDAHPYSRAIDLASGEDLNYFRNSVKATVDAYSGETNLYVFDPGDVLIQAYWRLFPTLFKPASAMPADLRAHVRYPEALFRAQAEMYLNFHMRDPEAFYNRADLWDIARTSSKQGEPASSVNPTYVVATLPGENTPEFMLIIPFTPANKDNLIGFMSARCDGEHLGELVFEQLSKQNIIYGPMQIEARINQDQNISKDLTLWNQQGSQVLRGQILVLPIDNSFLYIEPIYIQAAQASMPQLKKVALAMGNRLAYADTYDQALSQLISSLAGTQPSVPTATTTTTTPAPSPAAPSTEALQKLEQVRDHLRRYRELNAQGKWAEGGKELEEIQRLLEK